MKSSEPPGRLSRAMAAYLAELYRLGGEAGHVAPTRLAQELGVTPAAVARMAARLSAGGFVNRVRYQGLRLTSRGRREALRVIRRHRLAEAFLVRVMGYGWHEAHDLADALAEIADDTFVDRMDEKAGHPVRCPHGEPIPSRDGRMPAVRDIALVELPLGSEGQISRVRVRESERLVYLAEIGVVPGARFRVEGKAPFDGPIRLRLKDRECVLGSELARAVRGEKLTQTL